MTLDGFVRLTKRLFELMATDSVNQGIQSFTFHCTLSPPKKKYLPQKRTPRTTLEPTPLRPKKQQKVYDNP